MKSIYERLMKRIILLLLLIHLGLMNFANTYYVSNLGNDSNSGLTTSLPWKTLNKVNNANLKAGDQILLKRGDTWREQLQVTHSGTSGANIYYGAYGSGAKPLILGSKQENNTSDWIDQGNNIWVNSDALFTVDIGNLIFNYEASCGVKIMSATPTLDSQGEFWYDFVNHRIKIYSVGNPATVYSNIECARKKNAIIGMGWTPAVSYITFQNLDFRYWAGYVWAEGGSFINFYDVDMSFIGGQDMENDYRYRDGNGLQMWEGTSHDITIERCKIDNIYDAGITHQGFSVYEAYNLNIRNNVISNCEFSFEFFSENASASVHDVYFENNTCVNAGGGWSHYQRPDSPRGTHIAMRAFNAAKSNIFIRNNIFYNASQYLVRIEYLTPDGSGKNDLRNINMDYNLYFQPSGSGVIAYKTWDNVNYTFSNWKTATGLEVNGITTTTDQIFVSRTDFHLKLGSPAINGGINNNQNSDFDGNPIIGLPDMGAYESSVISDDVSPIINMFSIPLTSTSLTIPINALGATDNIGVTGYLLTESSSIPSAGLSSWVSAVPSTYVFSSIGSKTLYAWSKDAAGNISVSLKANINISNPVATVYTTEYRSICDGLSYNGWNQTGKYVRSFIAKSGADSIVTTYLTVNPKYAVTENITINEGENYHNWTTSGQYIRTLNSVSGCDSIVTTNLTVVVNTGKEGTIEYSQTLLLKKGNNLISSYLVPGNPDIATIVKPLCDLGALYKMQDEAGRSLEYWGRYGGWVNKIGNLLPTEGYNVNVKFDCSLVIKGNLVSLPLDIPLRKGWNFISFPQTEEINAMSIVQSLIDQNKLVKVQDEKGNSIEKLNGIGWVNNIGNFAPGKGYKVYVNSSVNLTIERSYPKSGSILAEDVKTEYFSTTYEGNGISHMNINLLGLRDLGFSVGDELGAFDGEICVGALKINEDHLLNGYASLVSSYSTDDQIQNGFKDGDQILIYAWNKLTGEKRLVQPEVLDGDLIFAQNASVIIKMNSITTGINPISNDIQIDVYPNPNHGNFTVRLNEIPGLGSRIDIMDISGRVITSRVILNQSEAFELQNKAPGMYFVKTVIGSSQNIHKLIIN